jgi:hypothetical protein
MHRVKVSSTSHKSDEKDLSGMDQWHSSIRLTRKPGDIGICLSIRKVPAVDKPCRRMAVSIIYSRHLATLNALMKRCIKIGYEMKIFVVVITIDGAIRKTPAGRESGGLNPIERECSRDRSKG